MKRLTIVFAFIVAVIGLLTQCGCEDTTGTGSDYPTMQPVQTGVTPALGGYSINAKGYFRVVATNMVSYSYDGYAYYNVPIHNGGISFSNGMYYWPLEGHNVVMLDESGNGCPTDGFAIWAQWTTPNHCEGTIWIGNGQATPFSANR